MNERIRELSDIAYKNHLARNPNSSFGRRSDYDREFALSIVRECAGIYSKIDNGNAHLGTENYLEALQKHFGVEE